MAIDSNTLYKLMVLFMLNKVNFPLTNNQLSEFFLVKEYTTYFTFQETISGLIDSGFINTDIIRNTTYYHILPEGEETLDFFKNQIPSGIIDDINSYIADKNYELRSEVGTMSDFYKSTNQDYIVHCTVKEGKSTLIELNISVPYQEDASKMCSNWKDSSQDIYSFIIEQLMK